jgi:hypothetical protein
MCASHEALFVSFDKGSGEQQLTRTAAGARGTNDSSPHGEACGGEITMHPTWKFASVAHVDIAALPRAATEGKANDFETVSARRFEEI